MGGWKKSFFWPSVCGSPWTEYLPDSIYFTLVLSFPGSDYFEETEGGQKEDGKEEEYIPSQHPTGIKQCRSCMNL